MKMMKEKMSRVQKEIEGRNTRLWKLTWTWMHGWMDGWMGGWMDGWIDGCMDG